MSSYPRTATKRDLLFLSNPSLRSLWPYLPVVRYLPDGEMDCSILFDACKAAGIYGTQPLCSSQIRSQCPQPRPTS